MEELNLNYWQIKRYIWAVNMDAVNADNISTYLIEEASAVDADNISANVVDDIGTFLVPERELIWWRREEETRGN